MSYDELEAEHAKLLLFVCTGSRQLDAVRVESEQGKYVCTSKHGKLWRLYVPENRFPTADARAKREAILLTLPPEDARAIIDYARKQSIFLNDFLDPEHLEQIAQRASEGFPEDGHLVHDEIES